MTDKKKTQTVKIFTETLKSLRLLKVLLAGSETQQQILDRLVRADIDNLPDQLGKEYQNKQADKQ